MHKAQSRFQHWFLVASVGLCILLILVGCASPTTAAIETPRTTPGTTLLASSKTPQPSQTAETNMPDSTPHVSPYVPVRVDSVEFRFSETTPVQVELIIRGILPDQCKYEFYSVENRLDQTVRVSLHGIHPADMSCPQTDQTIEYILLLGRDMPEVDRGFPPGDYQLKVNDYQTSFSIQ